MSVASKKGFTIIEVILFFGITGLMIAGAFIGIGASIGNQRYRDSVESFKSVIQQQYSDITNVYNAREGVWVCQYAGVNLVPLKVANGTSGATYRGQSRCDVVGKYLTVDDSGRIRIQTLVVQKTATPSGATEVAKLASAAYVYGVVSDDIQETQMEWGTRLRWPVGTDVADHRDAGASGDPRRIALLVVRSPENGGIFTFTSDSTSSTPNSAGLKALMRSGAVIPGMAERLLCVDPSGMVSTPAQGIFISANAADSSAVRVSTAADFKAGERC